MKYLILLISFLFLNEGFSQEKFKKAKPHKSISLNIPESFIEMPIDLVAERYLTSKKPTMVYTDITQEVDLDVNISVNRWDTNIELLKEFYKSTIFNVHKKVEFLQDDVVEINKRKYARLEYKSSFENKNQGVTKHYTYILFTVVENKIVVTSFRVLQKDMKKWQETANIIMNSIKMKDKLYIEQEVAYTPEEKALEKKRALEESKNAPKK